MENLLTGANPHLLYWGVALILGGVAVMIVTSGITQALISQKVNQATPVRRAASPRTPRLGSGHFQDFQQRFQAVDDRLNATREAIQASQGIVLLNALVRMLCYLSMVVGVAGIVLYLLQKYGVV